MSKCVSCGAEASKDDGGWYRERCMACIRQAAALEPTHREQCSDDDCLICNAP